MSYYELLEMNREPFSTSPDPTFFYESWAHTTTLMRLMVEIRLKRGLSVIMGDVGTGKTTLCRKLIQLANEREDMCIYAILDPTFDNEILFVESLLRTFGLPFNREKDNILDYKEKLKNFLLQKGIEENKTIVLAIDEAQKLSVNALEFLRTLLNYETNDYKLLQLVLFGQLELQNQLKLLKNFVDRISLKCILNPFDKNEVKEMIDHRLKTAGYCSSVPLFDEAAVEEIHRYTQGYLRGISMLCHKALRELVITNRPNVDKNLIQDILSKDISI